jgi:hypothetical protein
MMDWKNCLRRLTPALGIAVSSLALHGCANADGAPYHMYDSPLLEGRVESRYPRSRSYDPLELGDHTEPTTHYAENKPRGGSEQQPEPEASPAPKKAPALSTTRQSASKTSTGGPATTEASSRPSHDQQEQQEQQEKVSKPDNAGAGLAAEYIWSVYKLNEVKFSTSAQRSIPALFRECKERGKIYHSSRPSIGDVVFFHNTDDINGDGRNNDWYTHAAIVESQQDDGRTTLLGYRSGEVERFVMDLESPDATKTRRGEVANAQLRTKRAQDPPFTQYLAGQLFAGTCSVLGERSKIIVIDNWKPGMKLDR